MAWVGQVSEPIWVPDPARAALSAMARFCDAHGFTEYPELHRWSVAEPDAFWAALWDWTGMIGDRLGLTTGLLVSLVVTGLAIVPFALAARREGRQPLSA